MLDQVATTLEDSKLGEVPLEVSREYAADLNILRLHDQKHATRLEDSVPIVCQSCHYTPALDLNMPREMETGSFSATRSSTGVSRK